MERRILKAKRNNNDSASVFQRKKQKCDHQATIIPNQSTSPSSSNCTKNIASARMKRLRESLANDLKDTMCPSKKWASDSNVTKSTSSSISDRLKVSSIPPAPIFTQNEHSTRSKTTISETSSKLFENEDVNFTELPAISTYQFTSDSSVSLICHANDSNNDFTDMDVSMDWSPVSEEMLLTNINQAREILHDQRRSEANFGGTSHAPLSNYVLDRKSIYVVVDTNIFIDKLQTIINIMHIVYADDSCPVIYVPWMVIQELDYFKDGYSVSEKHPISKIIQARCRKVVKFINDCLLARKHNFKGQPVQRAADSRLKGHSADDSILSCCVQLKTEGYDAILLSGDTNLRNKAIISDINAYGPTDIIMELKRRKNTKKRRNIAEEISKKLGLICSFILHFEIKNFYGAKKYEDLCFKDLPWTFKDCIKYFKAQYEPVFSRHVRKQCRKVIADLHEMLFENEEIVNEVRFVELCLSLLIFLQTGLSKYDANIQKTIDEIKQLENECMNSFSAM